MAGESDLIGVEDVVEFVLGRGHDEGREKEKAKHGEGGVFKMAIVQDLKRSDTALE